MYNRFDQQALRKSLQITLHHFSYPKNKLVLPSLAKVSERNSFRINLNYSAIHSEIRVPANANQYVKPSIHNILRIFP